MHVFVIINNKNDYDIGHDNIIMTYNNSDNHDNHDNSKHLHSIFWSSILLSNRLMIKLKIVEKAIYQS